MAEMLRDIRTDLLAHAALDASWCQEFALRVDQWLQGTASGLQGSGRGCSLLAVGGYGRGELAPFSDLDLVVLHPRSTNVDDFVKHLSYAIYDQGIKLDISVRTVHEAMALCTTDMRVALGLLDGRHLWGDVALSDELLSSVASKWRADLGAFWLPELHEQMRQRHAQFGEVADLLEPDLKEAHGGLRDLHVIRAIQLAKPQAATPADREALARANETLLATRVALHAQSARDANRLLLQEQDGVAALLHLDDADLLMRQVAWAGRNIARISDRTWRRCGVVAAPAPPSDLPSNYEIRDGELLARDVPRTLDTLLHIAAWASAHELPLRDEFVRDFSEVPPVPEPWDPTTLNDFVALLRGAGVVATVEDLEDYGLFRRLLAEWSVVHSYHQRNAYHRYTVDRHLLETVRGAHRAISESVRPDLLTLACLFHDIGKGHPGDHTVVGIELMRTIGPRIGLLDADTETLVTLVRHHLLLADTASRRDLDDPATARFVASALGDETTLDLLAALTVADSTATGSAAWSSMKARLVDTLVERTRLALSGQEATVTATAADALVSEARASGLAVRRDEHWYSIATADRPGLLAAITASLAIEGVDIRSADLHAEEDLAVDRFYCEPGPRGWPEPGVVAERIRRGLASPEDLFNDLERRVAAYPLKRQSSQTLHVSVAVVPGASDRATVIELIAPDRRGLFAMVAKTVADLSYDVRAARLSTVGDVAIDTLYVREHNGPLSATAVAVLLDALEQRVTEFSGLQQ